MKKTLFLSLFISFNVFGQTPKMEIVASTTEDIGGIKVVLKKTNPINYSSAIEGLNQSTNGSGNGVVGDHAGSGRGVYGRSSGGIGVYGFAQFGTGTSGVYGLAYGAGSKGINGYSENGNGHGVYGSAESGNGVTGIAQNYFGTSGIGGHFSSGSAAGYALVTGNGKVKFAGPGVGTLGTGKFLKSINASGDAEWSDLLPLINSQNAAQNILEITNTNTGGYSTIVGKTSTTGSGSGIEGISTHTGSNSNSRGVTGINQSTTSGGSGVYGFHAGTGSGVAGYSSAGKGLRGSTTSGYGVFGESDAGGRGVYGKSISGNGVQGETTAGAGIGVFGNATNGGYGVFGLSVGGPGVYGSSNTIGGYFESVTGAALLTGSGKVGIGIYPNLNADERIEIDGRLRIRDSTSSAGVWFNNSVNSISYLDGAFHGMKTNTETGIFIGGNWRFWVNSAGNGYLNGNLIQTSDRRLKKDFQLLTNSLSSIYKLNGYHFKWKEEARSKDLQTGLIAQEVQKIFSELVQTDEKGFLSVNYIGLVPHLIEAVKELRDENNSLKLNNKTLSSRLDKIEAMLPAIQPNTENLNSKK